MTDPAVGAMPPRPPFLVRALRAIFRALLIAFLVGFSVGTLIRCAVEQSATPSLQYLGESDQDEAGRREPRAASAPRESARAA